MTNEATDDLHRQLVKLGDMMGDGLHLEPDGAWISRDYRRVAKALGYPVGRARSNNSEAINARMAVRVEDVRCPKCLTGELKQTRSGSKRALCQVCHSKWQLLK